MVISEVDLVRVCSGLDMAVVRWDAVSSVVSNEVGIVVLRRSEFLIVVVSRDVVCSVVFNEVDIKLGCSELDMAAV